MATVTTTASRVTINKARDFFERVGWTFIQSFIGIMIATNITGDIDWKTTIYSALISAGVAAGKVIIAQNIGETNNGELLPGAPVIEPVPPTIPTQGA